ncbi:vWA domain-containing protein [Neolewinella litorea]|uniref:VWA domain-containing protein n=1 Tax=Neolewinella litorea TaxID=2562452 RepID=A0A4S4NNK5_9BACT|nr:VWA-like domain-containing protein [Neolewinella litorea]THH41574.1 hypothetical protein E4021_02985 [Neolewinella litorea]
MSSGDRQQTAERIRFARAYAAEHLPWFAPALFRCRIVLSEAVRVAAVDRHYNVYWNPDVVNKLYSDPDRSHALSELAFLWVHEISHRLRQHGERAEATGVRGQAASRRWNVACDLEINDSEWKGLRMPKAYPGHHARALGWPEGELAETYYRRLTEEAAPPPDIPDEGSGVHGQARPWEDGDHQRMTPLDEEILRREVARLTREAADQTVPVSWREWAADVLRSGVNWQQRLGHRLSIALQRGRGMRTDYAFGRPNRRQSVYHPVLPPSLSGARTASVAIVVDTSASMKGADLQRALAEVAAIIRQLEAPVTIIPCDLRAHEPVRIVSEREAFQVSHLPGGGGTDMRAGLSAALDLQPQPDSVLVITDGMTAYPEKPYRLPLIFAILGRSEDKRLPPQPPFRPDQVVEIR